MITVTSDLLIHSLELVKNRVGVMTVDTRKTFIGTILVGLIEKTQDIKVMKAVCRVSNQFIPLILPSFCICTQVKMLNCLTSKLF